MALKIVGGYDGGVNKVFVGDSEVANEVDPTNTDAVLVFIDPLEETPTTITVISSKSGNLPITKIYTVSGLNYAVDIDLEAEAVAKVVYGETVSNLQAGVVVDGTDIEGTLTYAEAYTLHPVDTEGYFLALKVVGGYDGGVNKIYVGDSETANVVDPVTGAIVVFIDPLIDPAPTSITLECTKAGFTTVTKVYSIEALNYAVDIDLEAEAGATVVYGETVSNLQTGVVVDGTDVEGTLAYVEAYTLHPVDTEGYFLALKVVGGYDGGVNKVYVGASETANAVDPVTGAIVAFIDPLTDPVPTTITLECTKAGFTTVTKVYSIEALVYGADPTP